MIAGLILAGGKNSRMAGQKKLFLEYGGESFLAREKRALSALPLIFLSVEERAPYGDPGLIMLPDRIRGIGPLGGIFTALKFGQEYGIEAFFVTACDLPFISEDAVKRVTAVYEDISKNGRAQIVTACTGGQSQPIFGVYPSAALETVQEMIDRKDYRLRALLKCYPSTQVNFSGEAELLQNINTVEEYQRLSKSMLSTAKRPFLFAVSGYKNSGKTTFLTQLIPALTRRGLRVAVIKHDGHDFTPDVPGTDSDCARRAGAFGTAVYSSCRYMVTRECTSADEQFLAGFFPDADIILIEGLKTSAYPKIICKYPENPLPDAEKTAEEILEKYRGMSGEKI